MPDTLSIQLQNQSDSPDVYAYITGLAIQHDHARVLLQADGETLYFPASPGDILSPLEEDCAIPLGEPGSTTTVRIPQLAGGRIWFSRGGRLTFLLNPGPALVEPSPLGGADDANAGVDFSFVELTLDKNQLFANISYVDFVPRLPVALTLQTEGGEVQHVAGMPADGFDRVCAGLQEQAGADGWPWDRLIVGDDGEGGALRVLHPTHARAAGASFDGYYEAYVDAVWERYADGAESLSINTQAAAGVVSGCVDGESGCLVVDGEAFEKPSTADILGCNTGPFATAGATPTRLAVIPRLAAAFVRSSLLESAEQPADPSTFYLSDPTNHYCRVVHETNLDGKGYAFAYDDVQPDGGADQSGKVNAGDPDVFIIAVGGNNAYAGDQVPEY